MLHKGRDFFLMLQRHMTNLAKIVYFVIDETKEAMPLEKLTAKVNEIEDFNGTACQQRLLRYIPIFRCDGYKHIEYK